MPQQVVFGVKELIAKLKQVKSDVGSGMAQVTIAGAHTMEGIVKRSMNVAHHGREYRRGGRIHVASAPGETPAIDYGALINSLHAQNDGDDAVFFTNLEAAEPLEFGTAHMAARPFMRPAIDEHEDEMQKAMTATAKRVINEAAKK